MNITEETNDYFSTTEELSGVERCLIQSGVDLKAIYEQTSYAKRMPKINDLIDDYCNANSGPTEKLKTRNICLYGAPEWLFKMLSKKKK